jgi:diguanylate cyclase
MDVNEDDAAIVRSIIDLAGALGLRTVAEGVETRDAWDRLAVYGCDAAQGWYLAKAMPADIATGWLEDVRHVGLSSTSESRSRASAPEPRSRTSNRAAALPLPAADSSLLA